MALELDGPIGGAIDAELRAAERRVFQVEADLRARIEAEEALDEIAEVAVAHRPQEAVRQPERQLALRQPQVGVERRDVEVRLRVVRIAIRIVVLDAAAAESTTCSRGLGRRGLREARDEQEREQEM